MGMIINYLATLTSSATILFLNGLITIKHFFFNIPYPQLITVLLAGFFAIRLLLAEVEGIKAPHMKLNRRRL